MVYPDGHGYFPDSVSHRASRHVRELVHLAASGHQATAIFIVARGDIRGKVRPSEHHDPVFARECRAAVLAGVTFRAFRVACSTEGFTVESEIGVDLLVYDTAPIARWTLENSLSTGWIRSLSGRRVANGPFPHEHRPKRKAPRSQSESSTKRRRRVTTNCSVAVSSRKRVFSRCLAPGHRVFSRCLASAARSLDVSETRQASQSIAFNRGAQQATWSRQLVPCRVFTKSLVPTQGLIEI